MLDACNDPDLITEITLQPVRRYGVDAAIFFSDIVVPVRAAGWISTSFPESVRWSRTPSDPPRRWHGFRSSTRAGIGADRQGPAARRRTRQHPLIGFAGAPFTLASYLIEGGPSRITRGPSR